MYEGSLRRVCRTSGRNRRQLKTRQILARTRNQTEHQGQAGSNSYAFGSFKRILEYCILFAFKKWSGNQEIEKGEKYTALVCFGKIFQPGAVIRWEGDLKKTLVTKSIFQS